MHSSKARPKARSENMKRQCAQLDASSLTCRSGIVLWWYSGRTTCSADATLIMRPAGEGEVLEWRIGGVKELICRLPHSPTLNSPTILSVFRTMTPRRARECKVKNVKRWNRHPPPTKEIASRRDLHNFALYILHFTLASPPREIGIL